MKMTLTIDQPGYVTLSYDDSMTGDRITREFSAPMNGGYVREHRRDGSTTQPCDGLSTRGNTLMVNSRDDLPAVIRREYRAMRAAERRQ